MATLVIDLQDGFKDDTVVLRAGGEEVFHKHGVNTDYAIGRADSFQTEVPEGCVVIVVDVLSRDISGTIALVASGTVYLGISLLDQEITHRVSDEMFRYF